MNHLKAWLKLISTKDIGNAKAIRLVKLLGEPETFIENRNLLSDIDFLSEQAKKSLISPEINLDWPRTKETIERYGIQFVSYLDDRYPKLLKHVYDPPPFLFYRGEWNSDYFRRIIAIVGTRKASNYGKIITKKITSGLVEAGFTIVSGLAFGIDTLAHLATLETGGKTIAVLGTGCDQIYPNRNRELAKQIIKEGLLISEFIPGKKAERWNFPARNRIISGISLGTIVVEGKSSSGAMLTAKFAVTQNRDVFALPGDINREQAEGPNQLIRNGAKIITSVESILEEYDLLLTIKETKIADLTNAEDSIYETILQNKPEISFDQLLIASKIPIGELSSILLNLELKSLIKRVPGNKVMPLF